MVMMTLKIKIPKFTLAACNQFVYDAGVRFLIIIKECDSDDMCKVIFSVHLRHQRDVEHDDMT